MAGKRKKQYFLVTRMTPYIFKVKVKTEREEKEGVEFFCCQSHDDGGRWTRVLFVLLFCLCALRRIMSDSTEHQDTSSRRIPRRRNVNIVEGSGNQFTAARYVCFSFVLAFLSSCKPISVAHCYSSLLSVFHSLNRQLFHQAIHGDYITVDRRRRRLSSETTSP